MKLSNGAFSWESRMQTAAALSTNEAEYLAVSDATKDGLFLHTLLAEILCRGELLYCIVQ
jgi:hypothetical protein